MRGRDRQLARRVLWHTTGEVGRQSRYIRPVQPFKARDSRRPEDTSGPGREEENRGRDGSRVRSDPAEDEEFGFGRDSITHDTRWRSAVSWLGEAVNSGPWQERMCSNTPLPGISPVRTLITSYAFFAVPLGIGMPRNGSAMAS